MPEVPPTILETPRLLLRPLTMHDLDLLAALYRDPDVRAYFPEGTLSYDETREELEWIINVYYAQYGFGLWATFLKETGAMIGRCGLLPWTINEQPEVEVAYLLAKTYWGQGLATEVARAIVDYGFRTLDVPRLICLIDAEHGASQRVATKIGMQYERDIVDDKGPALLYSLERHRWTADRAKPDDEERRGTDGELEPPHG